MLNFLTDILIPLLLFGLLAGILVIGSILITLAVRTLLEGPHQQSLRLALQSMTWCHPQRWAGPPTYAVHVDGQLRYASGKEDVETFLTTTWVVAGRQLVRVIDPDRPATILLTCGKESILIEISRT